MYELRPPAVYAHESVLADPRYKGRLDRVVAALAEPIEPVVYTDAELPSLITERGLVAGRVPMGSLETIPDPILLLNTFRFDDRRAERMAPLAPVLTGLPGGYHLHEALAGYGAFHYANYNQEGDPHGNDKVCRPCWRIHFQNGCLHKCHYCPFGGLLVTMVNVEDYIAQLDRLIQAHRWQETFLLEDDADVLCLEPELGCLGPIIEHFAALEGRYAVIHTKSGNVEWMTDLAHRGNTIMTWSLGGPTQSRLLEPVTATNERRIEAARICEAAGYPVRYKFKPIIPVRNWRKEAAEVIARVFDRTTPDVISLCVFMWMDIDELKRRIDPSELAPAFVKAAEDAAEDMAETRAKPFPPHVRAEIYRHYLREIRKHDTDVPVSLSTENFGMWKELGEELGCTATNYVCGCGPNSTPGRKKLTIHPFQVPHVAAEGKFDQM